MQQYRIKVTLEDVYCRDTESVHSADKLAVAGAVWVDGAPRGIVMPMMRINDYERRRFPDDLAVVFDGGADTGEVVLLLQAWDLDENDSSIENREEIDKAILAIAVGVGALNPVAGAVVLTVADVVTSVVDPGSSGGTRRTSCCAPGRSWRARRSRSRRSTRRSRCPSSRSRTPTTPATTTAPPSSVESTWQASFGDAPAQPLRYEAYAGAPLEAWLGDWVGTDLEVSVERSSGVADQRLGGAALDVTLTRKVGGEATPTTTRGLVPQQASGASAGSRLREALSPGRRARRTLGDEADLGAPTGLEALGGGGGGGGGPGGVHEGIGSATAGGALRNREDGTRVETPGVLDRERVGDVVRLPDDAGLELLRTTGAVPAVELLRYARPFAPLVNELTGGRDVVLHRRANL